MSIIKDFKKFCILLFCGLLTAVIIYPFLHESGHSIATILLGGEIVEFHLLPLPNVLCKFASAVKLDYLIIGLSGIAFPVIVSIVPTKNNFCVWYISRLILGISFLATLISIIALLLNNNGVTIQNEDVITATNNYPESIVFVVAFLIITAVISIIGIVKTKPLNKILTYFEVKK